MHFELYQPTVAAHRTEIRIAARRPLRTDACVGLLWNTKPNGELLLDEIALLLSANNPHVTFTKQTKPQASRAMTDPIFSELQKCDIVLNALGDCGACSSWTCHDAVMLERAGTPTATVITKPFAVKCRQEVRALGMEDLPLVVLPHVWDNGIPFGQLLPDIIRRVAIASFQEFQFLLQASSEDVSDAYRKRIEPRTALSNTINDLPEIVMQ